MVAPGLPPEGEGEAPGVEIVRNEDGRFFGFRDPDTGRFISRTDAMPRLTLDPDTGFLKDTFGNEVGVGAVKLPGRGVQVTYVTAEAEYNPLTTDPMVYRPESNQEIVERVVFVDQNGRLVTMETSYGLGEIYDPNKFGGRWRRGASQALGLAEGERLPTKDLERAMVMREFIIKTTTY